MPDQHKNTPKNTRKNEQNKRNAHLKAMGIEVWKAKPTSRQSETKLPEAILPAPQARSEESEAGLRSIKPKCKEGIKPQHTNTEDTMDMTKLNWDDLRQLTAHCTLCPLSKTRTNLVFGVGNINADIMFIGEAPGANEDLQGEPFVGKGGMLLNAMLLAIGLERHAVYIANILKCRPPNNRDPLPQEVALCTPYLQRQIALIMPKAIVAVGRVAAQFLLNTTLSMAKLRGKIYSYEIGNEAGKKLQVPLFVIYHPAYLLRSPSEKSRAYADLLQIKDFVEKNIEKNSEKQVK